MVWTVLLDELPVRDLGLALLGHLPLSVGNLFARWSISIMLGWRRLRVKVEGLHGLRQFFVDRGGSFPYGLDCMGEDHLDERSHLPHVLTLPRVVGTKHVHREVRVAIHCDIVPFVQIINVFFCVLGNGKEYLVLVLR